MSPDPTADMPPPEPENAEGSAQSLALPPGLDPASDKTSHAPVAPPRPAPESPWPGLAHFTEEDEKYFFGRTQEVSEVVDRVTRAPLTVLYGVSGYGKSSLLGAGVIPALRRKGHPIVLLRRVYDSLATTPLEADIFKHVAEAVKGCVLPEEGAKWTLWEFFHDERQPWFLQSGGGTKQVPAWPVLIFDQFEEIFIKGEDRVTARAAVEENAPRAAKAENASFAVEDANAPLAAEKESNSRATEDENARRAASTFLTQLADLVENRTPSILRRRLRSSNLEAQSELAARYAFEARPVRVVLAIRDDFLPRLERRRKAMPSLMEHRVELRMLTGLQALEAACGPGRLRPGQPDIMSEDLGTLIVRASAGAPPDSPLEDIDAVQPPILSLLCQRLNAERLACDPIPPALETTDFELDDSERILRRFYDEKLGAHPDALRHFLEKELVSDVGFRENVGFETAVRSLIAVVPDVAQRLHQLLDDRILSSEGRVMRIEFTHDSLARIAFGRRTDRQNQALAREAELQALQRRKRMVRWIAGSVVVTLVSLGGMVWALIEKAHANRETQKLRDLVGFIDKQVEETFTTNVPVQLRERVNDHLSEIHAAEAEPADFEGRRRLMQHHLRRGLIGLDAARRFDKFKDMTSENKVLYAKSARLTAAAAFKEAIARAEQLAAEDGRDRRIVRDLILAHFHLASAYRQMGEVAEASRQSRQACDVFATTVREGPLSAVQLVEWMDLPDLYLNLETRTADDDAYAQAWNAGPQQPPLPPPTSPNMVDPASSPAFSNDLGMKFVLLPNTKVQFCIWQTRVGDFKAFIHDTGYVHMREINDENSGMWSLDRSGQKQRGFSWASPGFPQTDDHPVVGVNWHDAKAFCRWLTLRGWAADTVHSEWNYRIPTDEEWSLAVGLTTEAPGSPESKSRKIPGYPWGDQWPPPEGAGNFGGEELLNGHVTDDYTGIKGYNDGFPRTSPVEMFKSNKLGIFGLAGNVWQWCEDEFFPGANWRVLRGSAWSYDVDEGMLSSGRYKARPGYRIDWGGFRCVLAPVLKDPL